MGAALSILLAVPALADDQEGRNILLLYGEPRLTPALVSLDQALRSTIESRTAVSLFFFTEYLDLNLFDGEVPQRELRDLLHRKYASRTIDLIVAVGSRALRVALRNRPELFSNAPVVFAAVEPAAAADLAIADDVTGTWLYVGWAETLDIARRLQPDTRRALIVTGSAPNDRVWREAAKKQLAAHAGAFEIRYLPELGLDDVLKEVAALPPQTIVIAGAFQRDGKGRDVTPLEVRKQIAAAARVPVYALVEAAIGSGVVGGHVVSFESHGRAAGELAFRVLAGERPLPTNAGTTVAMFDERQLKQWKLDPRRLPPRAVLLFQERSLWDQYRWYIVGGVSVFLIQAALIGGLLMQHAQRRQAQRSLAERLRFETLLSDLSAMFAASPTLNIDWQIETALQRIVEDLDADRATIWALSGRADEASVTHSWTRQDISAVPSVFRDAELPRLFSELRQGRVFRFPEPVDASDASSVERDSFARFGTRSIAVVPLIIGRSVVGSLSVSTVRAERRWPDEMIPRLRLLADGFASALAQQRAEQAAQASAERIRDLAGRLITAHEEERGRIARELHDGVNQEVAALSIGLSALGRRIPATDIDLHHELARLQTSTDGLGEGIRQLSHELHPGVLRHAGLVPALRSHCREFEREHRLPVVFRADEQDSPIPSPISPEVALCLYRVTQEALRNVAKHAAAQHVWVTVSHIGTDVLLTIADDGNGFDPDKARGQSGLGLISLEERIGLVGGRLTIDTKPGRGTELDIVVPLSGRRHASRNHPDR